MRIPTALLVITLLAVGCQAPDTWRGVVYPDKQNLRDSIELGAFATLMGCGAASLAVLDAIGAHARGDYECGRNCRRDKNLPALWVCKETTRAPLPVERAQAIYPGRGALDALHELCMSQIHRTFRPEFVTYAGALKAWRASFANRYGLPTSPATATFAAERDAFAQAVTCLSATSDDVVPRMDMDPISFEVAYDIHAEGREIPLRLGAQ